MHVDMNKVDVFAQSEISDVFNGTNFLFQAVRRAVNVKYFYVYLTKVYSCFFVLFFKGKIIIM